MATPTILICPNCKKEISVDQALKSQLEDQIKQHLREEYNQKWVEEKKKLEQSVAESIKKQLLEESEREKKDLEERIETQKKELDKAREYELELRKKTTALEEKEKNLELEKQRQIDEERKKIQEKTEIEVSEKFHLREKEYEQNIESLKKSLEDAQRKASQGSQQLQGEAQEIQLEEQLKHAFPSDEIIEVAKGVRGADIIQKIFDKNGRHCGTIIWESKRTKSWEKKWVEDLKVNMLSSKGDVAVIVSAILPEGIKNFGFKEGVYVTSYECFLAIATILRKSIIDNHLVKQSVVGKNEKMEMVYNYFLSSEFQQRVSAIAEAFTSMKNDLDTEKRVFAKLWAKREKEIEKVILNTSSLHGEIHGLIGSELPTVKSLEFTEEIIIEEIEREGRNLS